MTNRPVDEPSSRGRDLPVEIWPPTPAVVPPIACAHCDATCCRLEVMLMAGDDVPSHLTRLDRWGRETMARLDDGLCVAVDRATGRCRIYESRPLLCREFEMGGPDCREQRALAGWVEADTPCLP